MLICKKKARKWIVLTLCSFLHSLASQPKQKPCLHTYTQTPVLRSPTLLNFFRGSFDNRGITLILIVWNIRKSVWQNSYFYRCYVVLTTLGHYYLFLQGTYDGKLKPEPSVDVIYTLGCHVPRACNM